MHLSDERLKYEHLPRILHFIWETEFLCFTFQNSFKSSVLFLYADKLKNQQKGADRIIFELSLVPKTVINSVGKQFIGYNQVIKVPKKKKPFSKEIERRHKHYP